MRLMQASMIKQADSTIAHWGVREYRIPTCWAGLSTLWDTLIG
jgi:hypothetical protein